VYSVPLFTSVSSDWKPPTLDSLPSWAGIKRIGLDTETRDPFLKKLGPSGGRRKDSYLIGVSFAIEDGESYYLPIRHGGGGNMELGSVLRYLRHNAQNFAGDIVGANLQYDIDILASDGITFPNVRFFRDVQVAEPLLNELYNSYSLQNIAKRWGYEGKNEDLLKQAAQEWGINPKSEMWKLPAALVGPYATVDASLPLKILRKQERAIEDADCERDTDAKLWDVYDLESRLLPVLAKVRQRGVRIDQQRLGDIDRWAFNEERQALDQVFKSCGVKIPIGDVWKPKAVAPILRNLNIRIEKTPTGKDKLDKEAFANIDHPAARAMERARKVNKLRTTFGQSIHNHLTADGRIHCTFNQLRRQRDDGSTGTEGAAYGRLSCCHPNLQQQPSRDEFAMMWRAIYLPEEGQLWAANDYSQQEPRAAVHFASVAPNAIGHEAWRAACEARSRYQNNPNCDNHQMMADMIVGGAATPKQRKDAKQIYLGLSYGMGGAKMCVSLGLPTMMGVISKHNGYIIVPADSEKGQALIEKGARPFLAAGSEGQALIGQFNEKVPFIKKLSKACQKKAEKMGYITTVSGRRCRFGKDDLGEYILTYKALNRLIQGSAGDQCKKAMIDCDAAGFDIIIQVHDEIAFSVNDEKEAQEAAKLMRNAYEFTVPSKVDVEIGISWGHSMGLEEG